MQACERCGETPQYSAVLKPRLLLAAGDELLVDCLDALLRPHYDVHIPRSGTLVRTAEQLQPAVIVLDDSLDTDPSTLCLTLSRRVADSPLLYLSSNWQPSLAAQLQAHGVNTVLPKPFAPQKLLKLLQKLVESTPC